MRAPSASLRPRGRLFAQATILAWGKAAQLVAVDGEVRQLVEVKLFVGYLSATDHQH